MKSWGKLPGKSSTDLVLGFFISYRHAHAHTLTHTLYAIHQTLLASIRNPDKKKTIIDSFTFFYLALVIPDPSSPHANSCLHRDTLFSPFPLSMLGTSQPTAHSLHYTPQNKDSPSKAPGTCQSTRQKNQRQNQIAISSSPIESIHSTATTLQLTVTGVPYAPQQGSDVVKKTNRNYLVLFGMQNRTFGP
jgi:hypothetical protein